MPSDVLRPKSFAGLFGAAPSVALATLGIAVYQGAAALDAAGASLGALGMLAFAIVFSLTVESSILIAFIGASLAWLMVSGRLGTCGARCDQYEKEDFGKKRRLRDFAKPLG